MQIHRNISADVSCCAICVA